jgi:hypothetical protein
VVQLYPQALGSLFVASSESEGYSGGIRPRLHTGLRVDFPLTTYLLLDTTRTEYRTPRPTVLLLLRMQSLRRDMSTELLPSNGRLFWFHYSRFQVLVVPHRQQGDL